MAIGFGAVMVCKDVTCALNESLKPNTDVIWDTTPLLLFHEHESLKPNTYHKPP